MRASCLLAAVCLAVVGCDRSGPDIQLAGRWTVDRTNGLESRYQASMVIEKDGRYSCSYTVSNSDGVMKMKGWIEGRFELKDDILIDTMTRHSNTNAPVPRPYKVRVLDYDGSTLTLQWENDTNQAVFHRETD